MSQSWRGAPRPQSPWSDYGYTIDRVSEREPLTVISCGGCWCQGELCSTDPETNEQTWPGIEDGAPHPRK